MIGRYADVQYDLDLLVDDVRFHEKTVKIARSGYAGCSRDRFMLP
jgi:hypothetical protein